MERATFYAAWQEKKLRGLFLTAAGNSGNAATRVEAFIYSKGSFAYGGYPDIDELFLQQARERDPGKRESLLHRIQQLTIDRAMFAPIWSTRVLIGVGPRVADHTINLVPMSIWPSYEDMKLKNWRSGKYLGAAAVPQAFDKRYFTLLVMAPYSEARDAHLYTHLLYPPDASKAFLSEFADLVKRFAEYLD